MSKNKKLVYIALAIAFAVFNVIAFTVPIWRTSVFWLIYAFTVVAFVSQIFIWNLTFSKGKTLKSIFLGLPIIHIGIVYLAIQLIAFALFLSFPWIKDWISIAICVAILGISAICLIATDVGREEVERVEARVKRKISGIKGLQVDVELIAQTQSDAVLKEAIEALADKIKYSDPMSDDSLVPIEDSIYAKITALKDLPQNDILDSVEQIEKLLLERNKKVKLLK